MAILRLEHEPIEDANRKHAEEFASAKTDFERKNGHASRIHEVNVPMSHWMSVMRQVRESQDCLNALSIGVKQRRTLVLLERFRIPLTSKFHINTSGS